MCARRFLAIIFWLVLLAVGAAFLIFQYGQQVLIKQAIPQGHFQAAPPSSRPDYSQIENWIDRPGLRTSPSFWRPTNDDADIVMGPAAIFYIHPTTYLKRDRWNAPICDGEECGESGQRAELFVRSQASAFGNSGTVWAPRYRQAAYGAFLLRSEDAQKALDLAYSDVLAAFDEFLKSNTAGPIILAGHSQGSLHLLRLLEDRREQLGRRLVAAYVVGWPVSVAADLPATGLSACRTADQTNCVISWQSFGQPANPDLIMDAWQGSRGPNGVERQRKDMLCVNPLTGTKDGAAGPQANTGTLVPSADLTNAFLDPGKVGARCDNGLLLLEGEIPALGPYVLPGNNYHVYDYAVFWANIRQDAARRMTAWQAR